MRIADPLRSRNASLKNFASFVGFIESVEHLPALKPRRYMVRTGYAKCLQTFGCFFIVPFACAGHRDGILQKLVRGIGVEHGQELIASGHPSNFYRLSGVAYRNLLLQSNCGRVKKKTDTIQHVPDFDACLNQCKRIRHLNALFGAMQVSLLE